MRRILVSVLCCTLAAGGMWLVPSVRADGGPIVLPDPSLDPAGRGTTSQVETTLAPPDTGTGRRAIYSKIQQRVWIIDEHEQLVRQFLVSGRLDMPNPGSYTVWSKSTYTCSIGHPDTCMRFMIRFAKGPLGDNIGFHEIPVRHGLPVQTNEQLGQPLSDGCLREATEDAVFMWTWAPVGTTVVVIP